MEGKRMALIAIGIAMILGAPMFGIAMAAPAASVPVRALHHQELLTITLMPPLSMRTSWYGGAVIPLIVTIFDENSQDVADNVTATVWVNGSPATAPGHMFTDNMMMRLHGDVFLYLLDTKPYPAGPGSSPITIEFMAHSPDDFFGGTLTVMVSLR